MGQYLLAVGLGRYKWYQSQTLGNVPARSSPEGGVDTRRCVSKDAGSRMGWIGGSHIDGRREQVSTRTLALKGGGL